MEDFSYFKEHLNRLHHFFKHPARGLYFLYNGEHLWEYQLFEDVEESGVLSFVRARYTVDEEIIDLLRSGTCPLTAQNNHHDSWGVKKFIEEKGATIESLEKAALQHYCSYSLPFVRFPRQR
ncbi:hypothetical protein GF342_02995 [Candidatus Woesearchaeota archaeon]|nr:hypothetical protein [Candidatus Woesearchaeota archaeon]